MTTTCINERSWSIEHRHKCIKYWKNGTEIQMIAFTEILFLVYDCWNNRLILCIFLLMWICITDLTCFILFPIFRFLSEYRFDVSKLEPLVAKVCDFILFLPCSLVKNSWYLFLLVHYLCLIRIDIIHVLFFSLILPIIVH